VIHIVTISELPRLVVQQVCRRLFVNYGVGAEYAAHQPLARGGDVDAVAMLSTGGKASSFADDKTLFLTDEPLTLPRGPMGVPPSGGYADPARGSAIVTTWGIELPKLRGGDEDEKAWLAFAEQVARRAVQQIGFLWGLHRCVEMRCAMTAPWLADAPPALCDFCRERSEARIRLARS
jgi:archaemetzincin